MALSFSPGCQRILAGCSSIQAAVGTTWMCWRIRPMTLLICLSWKEKKERAVEDTANKNY